MTVGSLLLVGLGTLVGAAVPLGPPDPAMPVPDTLAVTVETPDSVRRGEPVPIALVLTNRTERKLTLYLRGREIAFDLTVTRVGGEVVWRRLEGEVIPAILRVEELEAGARLVLHGLWPQRDGRGARVPAGAYDVQGSVLTDREPLVSPRRRLVVP